MWNPETDGALAENYGLANVLEHKMANKLALQRELGLEEDEGKFVIGLVSRLTDQKGLDLVNAIVPQVLDGNTQIVVLGTGERQYEDSFRYYEGANRGSFCACIQYDEGRAHRIYAGADAVLVPSRFEPCGLTQLNAMHYGALPIVRETGGLKDTVQPYNEFNGDGNGFTFDRYDAGLLLDAINRAKSLYFTTAITGTRSCSAIWPRTSPGPTPPGSTRTSISSLPSGKPGNRGPLARLPSGRIAD